MSCPTPADDDAAPTLGDDLFEAEAAGQTERDFYWRGAEAALRHAAGDAAMIPFEGQVTA